MSNFAEYISSQLIKHGNIMSLLFLLKHPNLNRVNLFWDHFGRGDNTETVEFI